MLSRIIKNVARIIGDPPAEALTPTDSVPTVPAIGMGPDEKEVWTRLNALAQRERALFLGTVVDDQAVEYLVSNLSRLREQSKVAPIRLFINSPGGSVHAGLNILDALRATCVPVHTICIGQAHSIAALILAAGCPGERAALEACKFSFTRTTYGGPKCATKDAECEHLHALVVERGAQLTLQDQKRIATLCETGEIFSAHDALEIGLIDEVISDHGRVRR